MKRFVPGVALLLFFTVFSAGCSGIEEEKVNKAGTKIGETVSNFFSGLGKGVKKELNVNVELAPEVIEQGLSKTIAKFEGKKGDHKKLSVYLIPDCDFRGNLLAKVLDENGAEIGRAAVAVNIVKDDAQYIVFSFSKEVDMALVQKCIIELKE